MWSQVVSRPAYARRLRRPRGAAGLATPTWLRLLRSRSAAALANGPPLQSPGIDSAAPRVVDSSRGVQPLLRGGAMRALPQGLLVLAGMVAAAFFAGPAFGEAKTCSENAYFCTEAA